MPWRHARFFPAWSLLAARETRGQGAVCLRGGGYAASNSRKSHQLSLTTTMVGLEPLFGLRCQPATG